MKISKLTAVFFIMLALIIFPVYVQAECGNGICEPGEEGWCPDCGSGPMCGNGICEPGEEGWCPDCQSGPFCGNGICEPGEEGWCPDCQMLMDGACCHNSGWCDIRRQYDCYDGTWQGPGSTCGMCPIIIGACCRQDGTCSEIRQMDCMDGEWMGEGTTCDQCGLKWGRQPDGYGAAVWPDVVSIADDFECYEAESIRRIDIWGMWYGDYPSNGNPGDIQFTLSIHANIPAEESPTGYSIPGEVLWSRTYTQGEFNVQQVKSGQYPGWYGPTTDWIEFNVGYQYWKYSFELASHEFVQQGGGTIYWLSVSAVPADSGAYFGWVTTSPGQSQNYAVFGDNILWNQLWYPNGHQYYGSPIDLALAIIGPSNAVGACCDMTAGGCMETTQENCSGLWNGAGSTCGSVSCPIMDMGACCEPSGSCMETSPSFCMGMWQGPGSSCGMCPMPMGACCMPMGECMQKTEGDCLSEGGTFNGPGSSCVGASCPKPTGACCDPMGGMCLETTQENCYGMWNGAGTLCAEVPCAMIPPTEGCCMPDGTCRDVMMGECGMLGGMSSGTSCASAVCPRLGACCLGPGQCTQTTAFACIGEWKGEGTDCMDCEGPIGPCCMGAGGCMEELTMRECMARGGVSIASCGPAECPGAFQSNPIPPWQGWDCPRPEDCLPPGVFQLGGPSGSWFEPDVAYGYMFTITAPEEAVFTKILDFPTGFNNSFAVDVNNVPLGTFGPGQSVDFEASFGQGVKTFRLTGISPLTDPESGTIFPIKLEFNVQNAQFYMIPLITVDTNRDYQINLIDYSQFAPQWFSTNCTSPDWCDGVDFDRNGSVDMEDLVILTHYWLKNLAF